MLDCGCCHSKIGDQVSYREVGMDGWMDWLQSKDGGSN